MSFQTGSCCDITCGTLQNSASLNRLIADTIMSCKMPKKIHTHTVSYS